MNKLQCMKTFVAVVNKASFSLAAHELHIAPATVSDHIASLEKELGVALLHRSARKVALTDDGAKYYELSLQILQNIEDVEVTLGRADVGPAGRISVEAGDGIASMLLMPVMKEFQQRYPKICLHILQGAHTFDLSQQGHDVYIRAQHAQPTHSSLIARKMGSSRLVTVASPEYLRQYGEPKTPHDLLQHRCIGFIDPLSDRVWEWFFEENGERLSLQVPYQLAFSRSDLRLDPALRGLGIVNDLFYNVRHLVQENRLKLILEPWSCEAPQFYILYPKNRKHSVSAKVFVDFLLEKYPPGRELDPTSTGVNA